MHEGSHRNIGQWLGDDTLRQPVPLPAPRSSLLGVYVPACGPGRPRVGYRTFASLSSTYTRRLPVHRGPVVRSLVVGSGRPLVPVIEFRLVVGWVGRVCVRCRPVWLVVPWSEDLAAVDVVDAGVLAIVQLLFAVVQ